MTPGERPRWLSRASARANVAPPSFESVSSMPMVTCIRARVRTFPSTICPLSGTQPGAPLGPRHHIGEGICRPANAPDMLDDRIALPVRHRRHRPLTAGQGPQRYPAYRAGPPRGAACRPAQHRIEHPRQPVVMAAERGTGPAHAVMINRNPVTINGREDPPAGARGHGADRSIPCSAPPPFLLPQEHAAFVEQAVDPVLGCAPGDTGGFLDLRDRKEAFVKRELAASGAGSCAGVQVPLDIAVADIEQVADDGTRGLDRPCSPANQGDLLCHVRLEREGIEGPFKDERVVLVKDPRRYAEQMLFRDWPPRSAGSCSPLHRQAAGRRG